MSRTIIHTVFPESVNLLSVPYALHAKTAANITDEEGNIVPIRSERHIGELYGGGIIFWLDSTGEHGLIVSLKGSQ